MKILAYKGVSGDSIALAIVYYNKLKNSGEFGKKRYTNGLDIILVTYTQAKKSVQILFGGLPFVFTDTLTAYTPLNEYGITAINTGSSIPADPDLAVTAVNTNAIYAQSSASISDLGTAGPIIKFFGDVLGRFLTEGQRLEYLQNLYDLLYAQQRTEELFELLKLIIAGGGRVEMFLDESDPLYIAGKQVVDLETDMMLGTDADGEDVILCRIADYYSGSATEIIYSYPSVDGGGDNDARGQAQNYSEHYAIIPVSTAMEAFAKGFFSVYLIREFGHKNSVADPDLLLEFFVGNNPYSFTVTQSELAAAATTSSWQITVSTAVLPPAQDFTTVFITGAGFTEQDGVVLVDVTLYVRADNVNRNGQYKTVYLPDYVAEEAFLFSNQGNVAADSVLTAISGDTFSGLVSTKDYYYHWYAIRHNTFNTQYHIAEVNAQHTLTVDWDGLPTSWYTTTSVGDLNTLSNQTYVVSYELGNVVVTMPTPTQSQSVISSWTNSYLNEGLEGDLITPLPGIVDRKDTFDATMNTTLSEAFKYDGNDYTYDGSYYKNGAFFQNYSEDGMIIPLPGTSYLNTAYSTGGLEQDRALRSWWHDPTDAEYSTAIARITSLFVKTAAGFTTVHGHIVNNGVQDIFRIYVNGQKVSTDYPGTGTAPQPYAVAVTYQHEMTYQLNDVSSSYNAMYRVTAGGGTFQDAEANGSYNASFTGYGHAGVHELGGEFDMFDPASPSFQPPIFLTTLGVFYHDSLQKIHPVIDYNRAWKSSVDDGYTISAYGEDALGNPISHFGYHIFPINRDAPTTASFIHWRGMTASDDGLCILQYSVTAAQYNALLEALVMATDENDITIAKQNIDAVITVLHNNFASPQMMRYFIPGECYTIFK